MAMLELHVKHPCNSLISVFFSDMNVCWRTLLLCTRAYVRWKLVEKQTHVQIYVRSGDFKDNKKLLLIFSRIVWKHMCTCTFSSIWSCKMIQKVKPISLEVSMERHEMLKLVFGVESFLRMQILIRFLSRINWGFNWKTFWCSINVNFIRSFQKALIDSETCKVLKLIRLTPVYFSAFKRPLKKS